MICLVYLIVMVGLGLSAPLYSLAYNHALSIISWRLENKENIRLTMTYVNRISLYACTIR